ncbi:hypothetical protein ACHHYP_12165 [Achlya hypogyna]|uniref:FYVE-type domain-containing protein n=1 Tax=Achlya hypogyna TaxID=1202772 RepID=A0A1V9YHJ4_ACHHY|nr:hypothetical protein ACHHYP_12165 [Achlya hypogyna]
MTYLEQGDKILRTFLDKTLKRDDSMRWSFVGEYDGVRLLEGDIPGLKLDKSIAPFRAVTKIHATLEEIAEMHAFETRAHCQKFIKNYAPDVLDLITLHTLVERTPAHPLKQVYVKWTVCESPVPIIKDRDFVYLESQDLFKLSSGRRGWALCQNSIELPYVQSLQKTPLQTVRGTLNHTGSVFIETDTPGVLDVIYHISTDMKGNIHHWVRKQAMKRRARQVAALNDFVHQARLAQVALKSKAELYTHTPIVHNCSLCERSLGVSRARYCQSCAEPVCGHCSRKWRLPNTPADQPSVRICNVCSSAVRSGKLIADDGSNHSTISRTPSDVSSGSGSDAKPRKHSVPVESSPAPSVPRRRTVDGEAAQHANIPRRRTDPTTVSGTEAHHTSEPKPVRYEVRKASLGHIKVDEDTMDLSYLHLYQSSEAPPVIRPEASTSSFVMMEPTADFEEFDDDDLPTPGSRHGSMDFDDPAFARFVDHITQAPMRPSLAQQLSRYPTGYPVPESIFDNPPLTPTEEAAYIATGEKAFKTFLDAVLKRDPGILWNFVGDYDGIRLLEGDIPGFKLDKNVLPYRALGKINATLEEIAALHAFETRAKCDFYRHHHAQDLADMFPLYSFFERTPTKPLKQMYIKWSVIESPVPIVKSRDFVFIEAQDEFRFASGRRGWAFCQVSVDVPGVQNLQDSPLNLIRGQLHHTGCAYIETNIPGVLDVVYHIASDFKGAIPHWVRKIGMKRRARHLAHLNEYVHQMRLSTRKLLPTTIEPSDERCCYLCEQPARFSRMRQCQSCGEAVCSRCSRKWRLPTKTQSDDTVQICNICSRKVRLGSFSEGNLATPGSEASSESTRFSFRTSSLGGGSEFDALDLTPTPWAKARQNSDPAAVDLSYVNMYGNSDLRKTKSLPTLAPRVVLFDPSAFATRETPEEVDEDLEAAVVDDHQLDAFLAGLHATKTQSHNMAAMYPLPDNFFTVPPLTNETRAWFTDYGERTLRTMLDKILKKDPTMQWNYVCDVDSVRIMEGEVKGLKLDKNTIPFRVYGKVTATLEEVALIHDFSTRQKCLHHRKYFAEDTLDTHTLYNVIPRTEENVFKQIYVRWVGLQSPVAIIKDRDFVFVESQNEFKFTSGRRGWAFCQTSVELDAVPELKGPPYELVRGELNHTGCVYMETEVPGVLDVVYHVSYDFKGSMPQWVRKLAVKNRARTVKATSDHVHQLRLSSQLQRSMSSSSSSVSTEVESVVSSATSVFSTSAAKRCSGCNSSFRFRKSYQCQSCSETVCSSCSQKWKLPNGAGTSVRICASCSEAVRNGTAWETSSVCATPASDISSHVDARQSLFKASSQSNVLDAESTRIRPEVSQSEPARVRQSSVSSRYSVSLGLDTLDLSYLTLYHDPTKIESERKISMDEESALSSEPGSRKCSMDVEDDPAFEKFLDHVNRHSMRLSLYVRESQCST